MTTVRALLKQIDNKYRSAESDTVKIEYMNEGQRLLSDQFGLVMTDTSLFTLSNIDEYALPSGIEDISQIETFDIGNAVTELYKILTPTNMKLGEYSFTGQVDSQRQISILHHGVGTIDTLGYIGLTGISDGITIYEDIVPIANGTAYSQYVYSSVTNLYGEDWVSAGGSDMITVGVKPDRYETTRYSIGYKDGHPTLGNSIYQGYSSTGVKSIIIYPVPTVYYKQITIRYRSQLPDLSITSLDTSPSFDSDFHFLLVLYTCWQICANGSSPDWQQANRFSADYEEGLMQLRRKTYQQQIIAPRKSSDNSHWHNRRYGYRW